VWEYSSSDELADSNATTAESHRAVEWGAAWAFNAGNAARVNGKPHHDAW
jgi:hypothetical protein